MNSHSDMRSFEAARRRQLIEATIDTVADLGFRAASLAEIARRANVSQGLFAHYFGDKDGLLEATLRYMAARLPRVTAARMRAARAPLDRLHAVCDAALADEEFDRRTSAVWLAFWGQIVHSEPNRRVQAIYQRRMRSNLRHGLRGLVAEDRVDLCATLIGAAIDGLWLQSHATDGDGAQARHARAVVRALIAALVEAHGRAEGPATPAILGAPAPPSPFPEAESAGAAFAQAGGEARATALRRMAEAIRADRGRIARLHARDCGLPAADTDAHDIPRAIRAFERAAEAAAAPREAAIGFGDGVFGAVIAPPSAGPLLLRAAPGLALFETAVAAAGALADGRAVIVCVSDGRGQALARLADACAKAAAEAGAPPGLLTIASGDAAGRLLAARPALAYGRAQPPLAAAMVLEGADLAIAAARLVRGARGWARGRHLSETLVFVDEAVRQALVERIAAEAATLAVGDPLDPATEIGPLASRAGLERALAALHEARESGWRLRLGGRAHETAARGRAVYLKPTVIEAPADGAQPARRVFAPTETPIVRIVAVADDAALAARLSALGPGLSLAVFGRDPARAGALIRAARPAACRLDCDADPLPATAEDWLLEQRCPARDVPAATRVAGRWTLV